MASNTENPHTQADAPCIMPRITIKYCTQCKWMLRAAYFAQELLSTFNLALGEVSLQPATGGVFTVDIVHHGPSLDTPTGTPPEGKNQESASGTLHTTRLWDRKTEGGFPEVKELKRRVRDVVEPGRNLGHVDRNKDAVRSSSTDGHGGDAQARAQQAREAGRASGEGAGALREAEATESGTGARARAEAKGVSHEGPAAAAAAADTATTTTTTTTATTGACEDCS